MKIKKYKYALFDWDGCLSNTIANILRICKLLAERNGIILTDEEVKSIFGDWQKATPVLGYADVEKLKEDYNREIVASILDVQLNINARELLKILHISGIPVVIVTTSYSSWIVDQAKNENILQYIDHVIGIEDVTHGKPNPEPIFKAMKLVNAEPHDSIMVGDTEKDIEAAKNAGIDSVLYYSDYNAQFYGNLDYINPTYKIKDLIELKNYFI